MIVLLAMKRTIIINILLSCLLSQSIYAVVDETPGKIALYWDVSFSMGNKERLIDEEIELVASYLKALGNVSVEIVEFGINRKKITNVEVLNGNVNSVLKCIENVNYEGGTNYAGIWTDNDFKAETILLFTDGNTIFEEIDVKGHIPVYCINSLGSGNSERLAEIAEKAGGKYIGLSETNFELCLSALMGKEVGELYSEKDGYYIVTGTVCDTSGVKLHGVVVNVQGTYKNVITNKEGVYSIRIRKNDVLTFNYLEKEERTVETNGQQIVDVLLDPKRVIAVGEVVVRGKRKRKVETVMTPYGKKDKASVGYSYQEIKSDDIHPGHLYLSHVLAGKPGIEVKNYNGTIYYIIAKNKNSSMLMNKPPIIVIDGNIYNQPTQPEINATNIESIIIRNTLAGTNKYGSDGTYGAIEITTKGNPDSIDPITKPSSALAKGNDYAGEATEIENVKVKTEDSEEIEKAGSFEESLKIYNRQKTDRHSVSYFIDVSDYFLEWNRELSMAILFDIMEIAGEDMSSLRVLAFKLEERGEFDLAKSVYECIAKNEPERIQSYRDLAHIYTATDKRGEASELYRKMNYNLIEGINFSKIDKVLSNETFHFVKTSSPNETIRVPMTYFDRNYKTDIRLVFEWSIPTVEFELQFVNPQKKFFKWQHTLTDNKERMFAENESGYQIEEFILDEGKTGGEWMVNLISFSDVTEKSQAYMKYTVYKHYGLPDEEKAIKVLKLNTNQENITIDKFVY